MCIFCRLQSAEVTETPPFECTFYIPASLRSSFPLDDSTLGSLPNELLDQYDKQIAPLKTTGDGNCQLHSISRACWGVELYSTLLKNAMVEEMEQHMAWYVGEESAEADEGDRPPRAEWEEALEHARTANERLGLLNVCALANVLKRPIIVYGSDYDMNTFGCHVAGVAGLFVPSRFPPSECYKRPICISWVHRGHFVPIVEVEGQKAKFPVLPGVLPSQLPPNTSFDDYVDWGAELVPAPLIEKIERRSFRIHTGNGSLSDLKDPVKTIHITPRDELYSVAKKFQEANGLPLTVVPVIMNFIKRQFVSKSQGPSFPEMLRLAEPQQDSPYVPVTRCCILAKRAPTWPDQVMRGVKHVLAKNAADHSFSEDDVAQLEKLVQCAVGEEPSFDDASYALLRRFLAGPVSTISPTLDIARVLVSIPTTAERYAAVDGAALLSSLERMCTSNPPQALSTSTLSNITHLISQLCACAAFAPAVRSNAHSVLDTLTVVYNSAITRNDTERDLILRFLVTNSLVNFVFVVAPPEHGVSRYIFLQCISAISLMLTAAVDHKEEPAAWMATEQRYYGGVLNLLKALGTLLFHQEDLRKICHHVQGFDALLSQVSTLPHPDLPWACDHVTVMMRIE
eukprot:TRINITY_DN1951_c0_g1_i3.p1 TRINITY_DN1951_c0_g1~~TRINITY_DN1951_c0_g1_i3.p1  ORF type:complete len:626 (+),score=150.54 TRINITY_DN1951_c0_g1_i3:233-2110(+)